MVIKKTIKCSQDFFMGKSFSQISFLSFIWLQLIISACQATLPIICSTNTVKK